VFLISYDGKSIGVESFALSFINIITALTDNHDDDDGQIDPFSAVAVKVVCLPACVHTSLVKFYANAIKGSLLVVAVGLVVVVVDAGI
jgi:hypothetical protein